MNVDRFMHYISFYGRLVTRPETRKRREKEKNGEQKEVYLKRQDLPCCIIGVDQIENVVVTAH
jgi:hypothetical protein